MKYNFAAKDLETTNVAVSSDGENADLGQFICLLNLLQENNQLYLELEIVFRQEMDELHNAIDCYAISDAMIK
jgi:hypothetical protein